MINLTYFSDWQCDSEIEDEFLPVVTEASLLVLTRVGETGDHSPTPTSVQSDTQNGMCLTNYLSLISDILNII